MLNPTEVLLFIDRSLIKLFKRKGTKRGLSYDADIILLLLSVYYELEGIKRLTDYDHAAV